MSVRSIGPGATLDVDRAAPVVCVLCEAGPPGGLDLLAARTPPEVPLLLVGWHSQWAAPVAQRELLAVPVAPGTPPVAALPRLSEICAAGDLVLVHGGVRVPPGWVERLRAAARSDADIGTVSPLGDATVGGRSGDRRPADPAEPDRRLAAAAAVSRPRVLIGAPHCLYVPRSALELIGRLPGDQTTLAGAIAQISDRCRRAGLVNVVADDLYVADDPPPGEARVALGSPGHERTPWMRAQRVAQAAIDGLSVTIDARSLGPTIGGTQRYTLELVLALARFTDLRLRAVVAQDIDPGAAARLQAGGAVEVISYEQATEGVVRSHIVHRPQQVFSLGDLNLLSLLGQRSVVTHADLIAYHNPSYHPSRVAFETHRRLTRAALAVADRVVFFSEHSRHDALSEDLIGAERSEVIGAAIFTDDPADPGEPPPRAPRARPYILCLGSDYRHKNRPFAITVLDCLRRAHGWPGQLVLAGGHVPHGSSREEEERLLTDEATREAVVDLGRVDDAQRTWLLRHARAVIVPSVVEGFGLLPLEAADAGSVCLFAAQPPFTEVLDPALATLVAWDAAASAARAMPLLIDGPDRQAHLEGLQASAARWDWEPLAQALAGCYARTMRSPHRFATPRTLRLLEREDHLRYVERRLAQLERYHDELSLVGASGSLSLQEQRGLLRLASRPALRRPLLWPLAWLGGRGSQRP